MKKKYQVFVSSTFDDLKDERQEVIQALLELDCIPVGMELFSANDDDQWTLIQRVIEDCDYYLVIVGGKYGSIHLSTGLSYTEMEYRCAVQHHIPIIGFLRKNLEGIPHNKYENDPVKSKKLDDFKEEVQKRVVKYWDSPADLGGKVSRSLIKLINSHPRIGWVKADRLASDDLIKRNFILSDENELIKVQNKKYEQNELQFKNIIRNIISSFGNTLKFTKRALYNEMFHAVELSYKYSADNLNDILNSSLQIITNSLSEVIKNQLKMKNVDDEISVSIKAFVDAKNAIRILDEFDKVEIDSINTEERFIITFCTRF